jgi:hypothetical protein
LNPTKFCQLIESERQKHPGKCLYHLTKSHQSANCAVKKECGRIIAAKSTSNSSDPSSSPSTVTGQLRHLTEESYEDAIKDVSEDVVLQDTPNNTNDEVLHYFARVTNHYLCLVKGDSSLLSHHTIKYPIIADSGANYHMVKDIEFFDSLIPTTGQVLLGDEKTLLTVQGIGTVKLKIDGYELQIENVCYLSLIWRNPSIFFFTYKMDCSLRWWIEN